MMTYLLWKEMKLFLLAIKAPKLLKSAQHIGMDI